MRQRHQVKLEDEANKPNHFFRFMVLTALTAAAATAIYFAVNSNAAAAAATGGAAVAKTALAATAAAAASSSLVPLIALTLLVGSILLLPFLFRGNAYHVRPTRDTVFVDTGHTFFPTNTHRHDVWGGFGRGQTIVVDTHGHGHSDHGHSHGHSHSGHGHDSHQTTTHGHGFSVHHR